jgi:site-specific DNA-methyltransferase (adenine-specific)
MSVPIIRSQTFSDGSVAINGDSTSKEVIDLVRSLTTCVPLIVTDPPYGNIVDEEWDKANVDVDFAAWMVSWTNSWTDLLLPGGAFYVWGGIGKPEFRPFFRYLVNVELHTELRLSNLITWSKRRAYGLSHNYLFTREELAYFVRGDVKKPRTFHVPLLETKRGYDGFNKKYPAKSEFYRRTNVWTDVNELFRGKVHVAQKPQRLFEVPIETHTEPEEWVIDPFAGSGTCALAAKKLGRRFVVIERDKGTFDAMVERLG